MKKLIIIAVLLALVVLQQGCTNDYRPNTQIGHHRDEINTHTRKIKRLNGVVHEVNAELLPERKFQLDDDMTQQSRIGARIEAWQEAR